MTPNTPYFENDVEDTWNASRPSKPVTEDDILKALEKMKNFKQKYILIDKGYKIKDGKLFVSDAFLSWKASQE